jgi:hypothetical protein
MPLHILGIRHHGVGSAKNVLEMLEKIQPDMILVEGPPELDDVMSWVGKNDLKPPISVLCYNQDDPKQAVFYPFAHFSPEWQAISFANSKNIPLRMMDMPVAMSFQISQSSEEEQNEEEKTPSLGDGGLSYFSELGGYQDHEIWWEHHFEQKYIKDAAQEHFEGVMLMMQTLRSPQLQEEGFADDKKTDEIGLIREAFMREIIRKAQNEMFSNIVVVCGAWHAPALQDVDGTAKADIKLLKGLPKTKIKVNATWVPWTNERLSMLSGYGAGIVSPGWYEHLWKYPKDNGERWLTKVAKMFRNKKMDISTAHVIESFRLAEALSAMRGLSRAGLYELNESVQTVMCMGDDILLELVKKELIVGNVLGKVPKEVPKVPLQGDFEENCRKLRLSLSAENKETILDLRKEIDLNRSIFLYRIEALKMTWGKRTYTRTKGTFKEAWNLKWKPEMMISLIEKGIHGNTVENAASAFLLIQSQQTQAISEVALLIQQAIPAELFDVIEKLLEKLNELATISADILELMNALLPLVDINRYGNVRKTDVSAINTLVEGLIIRICIGLPTACYGLDDDTSQKMFENIQKVNEAVRLLENDLLIDQWKKTLLIILDKDGINPLITGCTCRLLFDSKTLSAEATATQFGLALSSGNTSVHSAGWIEGFLKGSGMILLYDNTLWNILYKWVAELPKEQFIELLPILRRTFTKFEVSERRQLGEKAKQGIIIAEENTIEVTENQHFNHQRAEKPLALVEMLLGLN